jgi:hypothetical protein
MGSLGGEIDWVESPSIVAQKRVEFDLRKMSMALLSEIGKRVRVAIEDENGTRVYGVRNIPREKCDTPIVVGDDEFPMDW